MMEANAQRIVACVNAMTGIEDPEDFMKSVEELIKGLKENNHE